MPSIISNDDDNDTNTTATETGTGASASSSSSSSRLRRLDKLVIDQSSLLDEDDQIDYINHLNNYNMNQYHKYRKLLIYFYIIQVVVIISLNFIKTDVHDKSLLLLALVSVVLNLISIQEQQQHQYNITLFERTLNLMTLVSLTNVLVLIQVLYVDFIKAKVYYFAALSVCNYALPQMQRSTFNQIGEAVKELDRLKYKYKNV
ncbi:hypothetical protein CANMA_004987 [Candida margitis]|uniref:uncharacterized protein n=1 Tax=Candida margitis TaxID=1775924 RepID=UPI0022265E8C|nr:uncharacterized protein CANMA_004987 [Candida margitis]KAI5954148.1 hypothetical protein CANMA_004987 [Candida margitis]